MSTVTVKKIGSAGAGRDYSTITAWEAAKPVNLTTSIAGGEIWQGECYNDSEFNEQVAISGSTTDGTGYAHLTVAAGQAFCDNSANVLDYNQSQGAALQSSDTFSAPIGINENATRMSRLQVLKSGNNSSFPAINTSGVGSLNGLGVILRELLVKTTQPSQAAIQLTSSNDNFPSSCINCIAIVAQTSGSLGVAFLSSNNGGNLFLNCLAVAPFGTQWSALGGGYAAIFGTNVILKNCAAFGFPTCVQDTGTISGTAVSYPLTGTGTDYNASDDIVDRWGAGTHNRTGVSYDNNTFVDRLANWRLGYLSPLAAHGNTDATNAPNDIFGVARGSGTAGSIGPHETAATTGNTGIARPNYQKFPEYPLQERSQDLLPA